VIDNGSTEAPGTRSGALRLEFDERESEQSVTRVVASPSLNDVVEALESLDQEHHTELTVVDGSGAYITVGGGRGRYHVYMSAYDHDDRIVAQDPAAADSGETELVGHPVPRPRRGRFRGSVAGRPRVPPQRTPAQRAHLGHTLRPT
jgi:hypothetical protein